MSSDDRHESKDFNLEIDSAVESFFSNYEENAPKINVSPHEPGSDTISEVANTLELDDFPNALEPETVSEEENAAFREDKSGSGHRPKKKFDPSATQVFNSLTEAILTIDWEVNDANVKEARGILEEIETNFPVLKESRAQEVVDGMRAILDAIAASPQRVPTSAMAQLEKAIPILRGIASGAQVEDGYDELIEDVIAGLDACRTEDIPAVDEPVVDEPVIHEPAEDGKADLPDVVADDGIFSDNGDGVTSEAEGLETTTVPVGISRTLCNHSKMLAQLTPRARRLSDLYAAAQGSENVQALLQKICGLLELQTRALEDAFSLNCDIAVFPVGKIKNLSDFLGFQRMAMGVCLRHAGVLEKAFKKQPHRKRFWQSIYFLRIAMEKQIDELPRTAWGGDSPGQEPEDTLIIPRQDVFGKRGL